ncbi:unnamed protein product [Vitrella brassicaformis CCMP3155]|uniref:AP2/ERF domain-containing protein n=3 Tax=Vitrella brassicaformis TaxID=1169539 RepID=A0A0G4H110_VITBC|nr:unnamed protein product [Vitrella brassicaformis CCMP3155]|eukprot:CEM37232.1 unnamed protein product [Vitrella brassicaformis CCMP3155]
MQGCLSAISTDVSAPSSREGSSSSLPPLASPVPPLSLARFHEDNKLPPPWPSVDPPAEYLSQLSRALKSLREGQRKEITKRRQSSQLVPTLPPCHPDPSRGTVPTLPPPSAILPLPPHRSTNCAKPTKRREDNGGSREAMGRHAKVPRLDAPQKQRAGPSTGRPESPSVFYDQSVRAWIVPAAEKGGGERAFSVDVYGSDARRLACMELREQQDKKRAEESAVVSRDDDAAPSGEAQDGVEGEGKESAVPTMHTSRKHRLPPQFISGVPGVLWHSRQRYWFAQWREGGKQKAKFFPTWRYGFEGAKQEAVKFRRAIDRAKLQKRLKIAEGEEGTSTMDQSLTEIANSIVASTPPASPVHDGKRDGGDSREETEAALMLVELVRDMRREKAVSGEGNSG